MKAIIEFNLDNADDRQAYETHNRAKDMAHILWQLMTNTKKEIEYKLEAHPKYSSFDVLDMVFEEIAMMLQDENIDIDKLTS